MDLPYGTRYRKYAAMESITTARTVLELINGISNKMLAAMALIPPAKLVPSLTYGTLLKKHAAKIVTACLAVESEFGTRFRRSAAVLLTLSAKDVSALINGISTKKHAARVLTLPAKTAHPQAYGMPTVKSAVEPLTLTAVALAQINGM